MRAQIITAKQAQLDEEAHIKVPEEAAVAAKAQQLEEEQARADEEARIKALEEAADAAKAQQLVEEQAPRKLGMTHPVVQYAV